MGIGTAQQAIAFAVSILDAYDAQTFLRLWLEGNVSREEWSDYFTFLARQGNSR
jgi:hypothetical protein